MDEARAGARFLRGVALIASIALVGASSSWAQEVRGKITGRVTDTSKGPVAGATVTVSDAARGTHDLHNRTAGVVGTLRIPPDATEIELIAFDRTRRLRGRRTLEIVRVDPQPLPDRVRSRVGKLLGR